MMKRILFFIFCLLQVSVFAQSVLTCMGDKIDKKQGDFLVVDHDSSNLYVFRRTDGLLHRRDYRLEIYSRDSLKRLSSIKIPYPDIDSLEFELENIIIHQDYYQIIYSYFSEKQKQKKVNLINFNRLGEKIGDTKTIDFSEGRNTRKAGYFGIYRWERKNEILSYGSRFAKDTVYINIDHFNYDGTKLRSQNFKRGEDFGIYIYGTIDSEGNLFYLSKKEEKVKSKSEDPIYTSATAEDTEIKRSIKMYTPESDTPAIIPLRTVSVNEYLLSDRYYSYSDTNGIFTLICSYSQSSDKEEGNGIYLVQIDTRKQALVTEKLIPFTCTDNNLGGKNKSFTMPHCIITNVLTRPDNSIEIIVENRYSETISYNGLVAVTTYEIGSMFAVTVDSNFNVTRMCRIKKHQYVTLKNKSFTGFVLLHDSTRSFYIYNELPQNLNLPPDGDIKKVKETKLDDTAISLVATLNNKITEQKIIFNKADPSETDALLIDKAYSIGGKELYAIRRMGKEDYLVKFYLK